MLGSKQLVWVTYTATSRKRTVSMHGDGGIVPANREYQLPYVGVRSVALPAVEAHVEHDVHLIMPPLQRIGIAGVRIEMSATCKADRLDSGTSRTYV